MERNPLYDRAKAIGMVLVIYGHMFTYGSIPFSIIFSFHMPLFFIISGMLLSPSKFEDVNYWGWIKIIMRKYVPPVIFFSVLGGFVRLILYGMPNLKKMGIDFILHMSSDELLTGSIWFLSMLAFVMILMPYLLHVKVKLGGGYFCSFVIVVFLAIISYLMEKIHYTLPFLLKTVPVSLMFVFIGHQYRDIILSITKSVTAKRNILLLFPLFLILAVLNKTVNLAVPKYNDFFVYMFCALFGTLVTLQISTYKIPHFIEYLGRNSLIVFSLHAIWIGIFTDLLNFLLRTNYVPRLDIPFYYVLLGGVLVSFLSIISTMLVLPVYNTTMKFLGLR